LQLGFYLVFGVCCLVFFNAPMTALLLTLVVMLLAALAEWLHARRCRRVARLAFGPGGKAREWTRVVPALRAAAVGALTWGFVTLLLVGPRAARSDLIPEGGYRHLVLALDVSPSMQLKDAGPEGKQSRAERASDVLMSLLSRIATDQARISIVAFYTDAKRVVVDTFDMEVVKNALNDLPLDLAFDVGKTKLLDGVRESAELAKPWQPDSATLVVASDGDTIPDSGMPELPRSIQRTLVVGVGDPRAGRFIDGINRARIFPRCANWRAGCAAIISTRMKSTCHPLYSLRFPSCCRCATRTSAVGANWLWPPWGWAVSSWPDCP